MSILNQCDLGDDYYNRVGADEFKKRLSAGTLLMQGPMGSMLLSEDNASDIPPAFWNVGEPQTVQHIHRMYALAGAQVMLTNTFQASAPALERDHIVQQMSEVNRTAVDAARSVHPDFVVGSIGPCGLSWIQEDTAAYLTVRAAYRNQAHALLTAGCEALMLETFCSMHDALPALVGALDAAYGMPVLVSFAINDSGNLLVDGASIEDAVAFAEGQGAHAVGVNCCSLDAALAAVSRMQGATHLPVMVRPNAGDPERRPDGTLVWHEDPERFAEACEQWRAAGVQLVGSCCGTSPRTTAAMADVLTR